MANQPSHSTGPGTGGGVSGMHTAGVRPCPNCSTLVNVHATVCPNCGEQLAAKEKAIRCRHCRRRSSSNLVVCPHCGRELQAAASRWLIWGLPLLVVLLLAGALVVRAGRGDPGGWVQTQAERAVRLIESLGARLQPDITVSMIPAGQDPNDPLVSQAAQAGLDLNPSPNSNPPVVEVSSASLETVAQPSTAGDGSAESAPPTAPSSEGDTPPGDTPAPSQNSDVAATADPLPAEESATAVESATATPVPATPTVIPTATASPTPPATSTATNTPAPTATAPAATPGATRTTTVSATRPITGAETPAATRALTSSLTPNTTAAARLAGLQASTTATPTEASGESVSLFGLATSTPVPTAPPTATPAPAVLAVHRVRAGDTVFEIAQAYDVSVDDLLLANDMTEDDVYTIQPGDDLNIPAPTPEGAAPAVEALAATATPAPATYTVRAGDTLMAIALRLDLRVEDLLAANDMTINDARTLQPGDELLLPGVEGAAAPTATTTVTPTVTPAVTPTVTPTPVPTATAEPLSAIRLDAPRLRAPENGTAVSCGAENVLTWLPVGSMRSTDLYLLHLGYVDGAAADGSEQVVWVITQPRPAGTTSWTLDNDLCGLAPSTSGRQWRWYVEVVERTSDGYLPVSAPSTLWGFAWQ